MTVKYSDNGFYLELNGNEWKDIEKPKCTLAKEAIWKVRALDDLNTCNTEKGKQTQYECLSCVGWEEGESAKH